MWILALVTRPSYSSVSRVSAVWGIAKNNEAIILIFNSEELSEVTYLSVPFKPDRTWYHFEMLPELDRDVITHVVYRSQYILLLVHIWSSNIFNLYSFYSPCILLPNSLQILTHVYYVHAIWEVEKD